MQKKWWHSKTAYQIYPKSFQDSTGSGMGDLNGITSRLDYLEELGVELVWISPCYVSPLADGGYDIADYYRIDPRFGTNEDLYRLIAEAKKRGIGIVMDLVVNHCSDEHEWFQKALRDPYGEYADYFYFEKGTDGRAPNNWRSYFGGSAWEKVPGTDLYYLHMFHKKQPDLNWENPKLREEIYRMINWWLDRGISGFRLDAIMNIKKPLPLAEQNYPADRSDGLAAPYRMISRAHGILDLLNEMRDRCFAPHGAFTVGEIFNQSDDEIPLFIGDDGCFSSMFDFRAAVLNRDPRGWYAAKDVTPDEYRDAVFETQRIVGDCGMISTIIENHDEPRGVSRYLPPEDLCDTSKKFLAAMQFMQRGFPFIYEGQEIGMSNQTFHTIDEVNDVSTIDEYEVARRAGLSDAEALRAVSRLSRDNARTPMQWDGSDGAGFTSGTPWLRLNDNYRTVNVEAQRKDPGSVLSWYKKLIRLRKDPEYGETIVSGTFLPWKQDEHEWMAFFRDGTDSAGKKLLVLGNYRRRKRTVELPSPVKKIVLDNCAEEEFSGRRDTMDFERVSMLRPGQKTITLQGYEAAVVEL